MNAANLIASWIPLPVTTTKICFRVVTDLSLLRLNTCECRRTSIALVNLVVFSGFRDADLRIA